MKVSELVVESFKKISRVALKLGQHVTEISGPNGAGKSSYLDALWVLLDGKRVAPVEPIRQGAQLARIQGRIGEYLVTRTFRRGKGKEVTTSLRIERGTEAMPSTEAFLKSLIGDHMLDPGEFIALDSKGKFNALKSFVPDIDFDKVAREQKADYDRRTDVNRLASDASAAANMITVPDATPEALVDEADLTEQLGKAAETNADIERRRGNRKRAQDRLEQLRAIVGDAPARQATGISEVCERRNRTIADLHEQISALERRIDAARIQCDADVQGIIGTIERETQTAQTELTEKEERLAAAGELPEPVDVAALQAELTQARKTNEAVRRRQERAKHLKVAEQYEAEAERLTEAIKSRERAKQTAIASAKLPVAAISFGEGELLHNGVPFEQASTAQKLRVGVAIAVQKNPTLRLAWIRDASLFDDESYRSIKQLSEEFDCQILLETVRAIGSDAILLEDGHLKGDKAVTAAEAAPA